MTRFHSSDSSYPRSLMSRIEVRGNVCSKLIGCLIESNLIDHIALLHNVCFIFMKVFFLSHLSSIEFFCQITLKSEQNSLRRGKNDARHGAEGPFEEKREDNVEYVAIDKNTTEQKKEVLVFKKDHLLLTEEDYQKAHSLVTSKGKVCSSKRSKERGSKNLSND
jgi:hypothetical protein